MDFARNSFAHHFRHDENEEGPAQPTTKEEINQGITGSGKHGCYQKCNHRYGMEKWLIKIPQILQKFSVVAIGRQRR